MKKHFSKLLFLTILFLIFPAVSFADISQIGFTTDPQTIKPNTQSEKITVQTQDSSSSSFQTPETLYLELTSSSAMGEFSSSETSWKATDSVTMSKNSANRSFYYKDSTEGTFIITVNITGKTWSSTQNIVVSSGASQNTQDSSGEVLSASDNSSSSSSSSGGGGSVAHVSSLNAQLEILAGSDRTTSPGSPIWFQATVKKNTTSANSELNWSFGDGEVGVGSLVSHTYKYSGDYVVVLTMRVGDIFSVSRLKVKVIEPNMSVRNSGEYLEISNNSDAEINLFNWKIENEGQGFIFQPNTIILPHSSIKFDKNLLKMKGLDNSLGISLKNGLGQEVFSIAPVQEVNLNEVSKNIETIKEELSIVQEKARNLGLVSASNNANNQLTDSVVSNISPVISANKGDVATSTENVIYEAPKSEGFITKLTNFIKRVFSK